MRLGRWLLGGILACGAVAIALQAAGVHSPVRPVLVLVFLILAPAVAIGGLLGGFDPLARAVLAVGSSLVVLTLTAMIMVAGGFWNPTGGLLAVAIFTVVCLAVRWPPVARRLSAAGGFRRGHGQGQGRPI